MHVGSGGNVVVGWDRGPALCTGLPGAYDLMTQVQEARRWETRLPSPQIVIFKGVGHPPGQLYLTHY